MSDNMENRDNGQHVELMDAEGLNSSVSEKEMKAVKTGIRIFLVLAVLSFIAIICVMIFILTKAKTDLNVTNFNSSMEDMDIEQEDVDYLLDDDFRFLKDLEGDGYYFSSEGKDLKKICESIVDVGIFQTLYDKDIEEFGLYLQSDNEGGRSFMIALCLSFETNSKAQDYYDAISDIMASPKNGTYDSAKEDDTDYCFYQELSWTMGMAGHGRSVLIIIAQEFDAYKYDDVYKKLTDDLGTGKLYEYYDEAADDYYGTGETELFRRQE